MEKIKVETWRELNKEYVPVVIHFENNGVALDIEVKPSINISEQLDVIYETVKILRTFGYNYERMNTAIFYSRVLAHYTNLDFSDASIEDSYRITNCAGLIDKVCSMILDDIGSMMRTALLDAFDTPSNQEIVFGKIVDAIDAIENALPDSIKSDGNELESIISELMKQADEQKEGTVNG